MSASTILLLVSDESPNTLRRVSRVVRGVRAMWPVEDMDRCQFIHFEFVITCLEYIRPITPAWVGAPQPR